MTSMTPPSPALEAKFWRAMAAVCGKLSAQTNVEGLVSLAATSMMELASAGFVSVYIHEAEARFVLRACAGDAGDTSQTPSLVAAADTSRTVTAGEGALAFPLLTAEETSRGVVHVACSAADDMLRAGLSDVAKQLAIGLAQTAVYEELEGLVEREMMAAVEREQAIQLVLDSMADGLLVCDLSGEITPIRSKVATEWFGEPPAGTKVWAYLGGDDTAFTEQFELGFGEMAADFLPFEVNAMHLPKLLHREQRAYAFACRQVLVDGVFAQIVVTVTDVTDALAAEKLARAARELPEVVGNLLRDRDGFNAMIVETERLLSELGVEVEGGARARIIHTLKGNSSVWGFLAFSHVCHELEDALDGDASSLQERQVQALSDAWNDSLRGVRVFVDIERGDQATTLRISHHDHGEILERLARREDQSIISAVVREWTRAPLRAPLDTQARQAERLAENLGKRVKVVVDADGRMPPLPVPSLVAGLLHAVRNALDHGIETPDERVAAGKPPEATLWFGASACGDVFEVVVEDDGRGIDWSAVRGRAQQLGLVSSSDEDAHEALFSIGLSTAERTTDISGRGIGMAAVREAFRRLGGDVHVESRAGQGTRVVCRAPVTSPSISP